jgi:porphobilinogen deaminase
MSSLRIGLGDGHEEVKRYVNDLASWLLASHGLESAVVTISGSQNDRPESFSDLERLREQCRDDLLEALAARAVDLAVAPADYWPFEENQPFDLRAVLGVADVPCAVLRTREGLVRPTSADPIGLPPGTRVAVLSTITACQLLDKRPDLAVVPFSPEDPALDAVVAPSGCLPRPDKGIEESTLAREAVLSSGQHGRFVLLSRADELNTMPLASLDDPGSRLCFETERRLLERLQPSQRTMVCCLASTNRDGSIRLLVASAPSDDEAVQAEVSRIGASGPQPDSVVEVVFHALKEVTNR